MSSSYFRFCYRREKDVSSIPRFPGFYRAYTEPLDHLDGKFINVNRRQTDTFRPTYYYNKLTWAQVGSQTDDFGPLPNAASAASHLATLSSAALLACPPAAQWAWKKNAHPTGARWSFRSARRFWAATHTVQPCVSSSLRTPGLLKPMFFVRPG